MGEDLLGFPPPIQIAVLTGIVIEQVLFSNHVVKIS